MVTASTPLRIVFFGTPDFAVPTLQALHESRHPVVGVVAQPDRASGRGHRLRVAPVKRFALDHTIEILQPDRLGDERFLDSLRAHDADLGVVAAYGKILTDAVLQIPKLGFINVHASLLPKYRGAAPIQRAVLAGETETGISIMRVVKALDAGPTFAQVSRAIGLEETSSDVERDLARIGATALVEVVDAMAHGSAVETPQDHSQATYAAKVEKADGVVDWARPAATIHNQVRGLHPWPHAFSELEGERTILLRAEVDRTARDSVEVPGTVIEAHGDRLCVATGGGVLRLLVLQREGRRPVSVREFLTGRRIQPGARFQRSQLIA